MSAQSQQNESDNINEIAEQIFTKPPGPPKSIELQLEEITADLAQTTGVTTFVFNILCLLTFRGMEILYGGKEKRTGSQLLLTLTEPQFRELGKYVASYGYKIEIFANNTEKTPWELIRNGERVYRYNIGFERL